jgi:hypothetical protein
MDRNRHLIRSIRAVLYATALAAAPLAAAPEFTLAASASATQLQQDGRRALDAGDYAKAAAVYAELAKQSDAEIDAALYWKAYAEFKARRAAEAKRTLDQFFAGHAKSRWARDAQALKVDVELALGGKPAVNAALADEELKLYALDGLMQMDPKQALPILKRFMAGQHSPRLKERALFVASQSELPEAQQLVLDAARNNADPDLQRRAVNILGASDEPKLIKALLEVYKSSNDQRVKRSVLDAWVAADAKDEVLAAARTEADPGLRRHAVHMLGALDATAELKNLLANEKDPGVRRAILDGFVAADDAKGILDVARGDPDAGMRRYAAQLLGAVDATEELRGLLRTEKDPGVRRAILEGFVAADDSEAVLEVARTESDPALRRYAIQMLGAFDGDDDEEPDVTGQVLEQIYAGAREPAEKRALIEALHARDDAKTILKLFRAEQDPALKRHMVQMLSTMDAPEAQQMLLEILDK